MPRAVITHGYSPAPRGLTVLRCRHRVLAVCASLFLVVAAVATAVIIVSQWQQNSHTAHNVIAQSNTWVRVEKAHAPGVAPRPTLASPLLRAMLPPTAATDVSRHRTCALA